MCDLELFSEIRSQMAISNGSICQMSTRIIRIKKFIKEIGIVTYIKSKETSLTS